MNYFYFSVFDFTYFDIKTALKITFYDIVFDSGLVLKKY